MPCRAGRRQEAITLEDAEPGVLTLPTNMLSEIQDLEDLELLEQQERQVANAADPHGRPAEDIEEEAGGRWRRRRAGRAGAGAGAGTGGGPAGLLADDLLMLATLATPGATQGVSEGAARTEP